MGILENIMIQCSQSIVASEPKGENAAGIAKRIVIEYSNDVVSLAQRIKLIFGVDLSPYFKSVMNEITIAEGIILKDNSMAYKDYYTLALKNYELAKEEINKIPAFVGQAENMLKTLAVKLDRFVELENTQKLLLAAGLSSKVEDFRLNNNGTLVELIKRLKSVELYENESTEKDQLQNKHTLLEKDYAALKEKYEKLELEHSQLKMTFDIYAESLVAYQENCPMHGEL